MIEVTRELPEDVWRQYVAQHPAGNIFHTPEMFEVFRRAKNHRPELWAVLGDGGVLALMTPVRITLMPGFLKGPFTTRSVVYGSLLCAPGAPGEEAVTPFLKSYVRETRPRPIFTELRNISDLSAFQPALARCGFKYQAHLNYLIDLARPSEDVFNGIGPRTRKNIRHALNKKLVEIEEVTTKVGLATCYSLLRKTYGRASVPLADSSLFEAAFDLLAPKGMVRYSLAKVGSTPVAVSVDLIYKDVIYGWYGGIDRDYRNYSANELLTWSILKWGVENGYRLYDFGGAGDPSIKYGVRDFKAKFGGHMVSYGRYSYVHSPLRFGICKIAYGLLQPLLYGTGSARGAMTVADAGEQ